MEIPRIKNSRVMNWKQEIKAKELLNEIGKQIIDTNVEYFEEISGILEFKNVRAEKLYFEEIEEHVVYLRIDIGPSDFTLKEAFAEEPHNVIEYDVNFGPNDGIQSVAKRIKPNNEPETTKFLNGPKQVAKGGRTAEGSGHIPRFKYFK